MTQIKYLPQSLYIIWLLQRIRSELIQSTICLVRTAKNRTIRPFPGAGYESAGGPLLKKAAIRLPGTWITAITSKRESLCIGVSDVPHKFEARQHYDKCDYCAIVMWPNVAPILARKNLRNTSYQQRSPTHICEHAPG